MKRLDPDVGPVNMEEAARVYDMRRERAQWGALAEEPLMDAPALEAYLAALGNPPMLALGELRDHPLHAPDTLPLRWHERPNGDGFTGQAQPGEYYAFQIGVYAAGQALARLRASWTDLVAEEGVLPSGTVTCFALEGTDCAGKPMLPEVSVETGHMRALWFGVPLPREAKGRYRGRVAGWAEGVEPVTVCFEINVSGDVLRDQGDSEPWRHSRLRWLNSTLALDEEVTAPFAPVTLREDTVSVLGRRIALGGGGLPARIASLFAPTNETLVRTETPILAAPIAFEVDTAEGTLSLRGAYTVVSHSPGALRIASVTADGNLTLTLEAMLAYDGYAEYGVTVSAKTPLDIRDVRLRIPYARQASDYWMGLGQKGGLRRGELSWRWDATLNQDTLWMGSVNAGLMVRLKGTDYEKPYMLIYYHYKPLRVPACWDNGGQGGVRVEDAEQGPVFTAFGGCRRLLPDSPLTFRFDLAVTPVKPIHKAEHWNDHYYPAAMEDLKAVSRSGANVINLHHANRYNPFINYPFWETQRLAEYVDRCHENSLRVKLYYTVKELTVRTPEFWAFKSLGGEIFPSTYECGGSFQGAMPYADEWLRTHVKEKYITAWRQRVNSGPYV